MQRRAILALVLLAAAATTAFGENPVMFRGDATHAGVYSSAAPSKAEPLWTIKTGNKVRSTPAVVGEAVYFGSDDGKLYAATRTSGKILWTADLGAPVSSSPAVAAGLAYVNSDKAFAAFEAASGKLRWRHQHGKALPFEGRWDYYVSSPVVADGKVLFGSVDGNVYALDAKTGAIAWKFATGGIVRATPAVDTGVVYAGSMDGNLYALELATGKLKWKFKTAGNKYFPLGEIQSSAAVAGGMVYFGSRDGHLYALDAKTGEKRWAYSHEGSWVISSPAVANGMVLAGSSDGQFLNALDAQTGAERWRYKVPANIFASPVVADGLVYMTDWGGRVLWLDVNTGKVKGGYIVDGPVQSSPVVVGGVVFFGSDNDTMYALK